MLGRLTIACVALILMTADAVCETADCDRSRFRIVIDVGHTARTPGAISARGVPEFTFNAKLADVVAARLRAAGFTGTVVSMRLQEDLMRRAGAADLARPSLILSLHHDSAQARYLKMGGDPGMLRPYSTAFSGYSIFVSRENVDAAASEAFAILLGRQLQKHGRHSSSHHAEPVPGEGRPVVDAAAGVFGYDRLVILRHVSAPAALLEAAVIVNPDDEALASTPAYREVVADSVAVAAGQFCDARSTPPTRPAERPAGAR